MGRFSLKAPYSHGHGLLIIFFSLTFFLVLALADHELNSVGTRWAVLIAGSNGYGNYRHQADVCHAYQILKKGGLKDENIVVFMYDDIANNQENPRPGVIINSPNGTDVYKGVPKDYTGDAVNVNNFLSVIIGNKTAVKGGSGKVLDNGPNDRIFIYYSDHGGPGVLGMPKTSEFLYANDLIETLKKKHASGTYKSLVFYLESCESGSIFEGLLPQGLNIYVTTAANATENSYGTYCPGDSPAPPHDYTTCLGDLYSISWLEDCDEENMGSETLNQQYELVKNRTGDGGDHASHVMQYGNLTFKTDDLSTYFGINNNNNLQRPNNKFDSISLQHPPTNIVHQRDAEILHLWHKFWRAPQGSSKKIKSEKELVEAISNRMHVDKSIEIVGKHLFASHHNLVLNYVRRVGQPLVDDWECLKSLVKIYENYCGPLRQYGMKHMRSFANMCNIGINNYQMTKAAGEACVTTN